MRHPSIARLIVALASSVALSLGLAQCGSSHPPLARDTGNDTQPAAGTPCWQQKLTGGCNVPVTVFNGPLGLPLDKPLTGDEIVADDGGGATACIGFAAGDAVCGGGSTPLRYTCVSEGVVEITSVVSCSPEAGAGEAGADDGGAAEAAADAAPE